MKAAIGLFLAAFVCSASLANAVGYSNAVTAASAILGAIDEATAFFSACRDVDGPNAAIYDGLAFIEQEQDGKIVERIDTILRVEGTRAGLSPTFYPATIYPLVKQSAIRGVNGARSVNPIKFISTCGTLRDAEKKHLGFFAPLRQRFPDWMNVIDEWK